jgi:hypothetical protein
MPHPVGLAAVHLDAGALAAPALRRADVSVLP